MGKPEVPISKIVFVDLYNQGKSGLEIARFFGIGRTTVSRYYKRYGLKPRTISEVRQNNHWSPSEEQKRKLSELGKTQTGNKNPGWKGGKSKTAAGYIVVRVGDRYIKEHRYIMEQHLGRKLKPTEHIHHLNGSRADNRIENLKIVTNSDHIQIEWTAERRNNHSQKIKEIRSRKYWRSR